MDLRRIMICAVCLAQGRKMLPDPSEILAAPAFTVANGQALCPEHYDALHDWQTADAGQLSLLAAVDVLSPDEPPEQ